MYITDKLNLEYYKIDISKLGVYNGVQENI